MKTIWKYPLEVTDEQTIMVPKGGRLLTVQVQNGVPCLWALVDPVALKEPRTLYTYGTGHPVGVATAHLGSYQLDNGLLVFHVFSDYE